MAVLNNTTLAADVVPQITVDYVSRFRHNINALQAIIGVSELMPLPEGNAIKVYAISQENTPSQPSEGDEIALTEIKRTVAKTIDMELKNYRKLTTDKAIQKSGREVAIDKTDEKFISGIQKAIKTAFFTSVKTGTGTVTAATTLQAQLASNWAALETYYEDEDLEPIHFVHPTTAAAYLGSASISLQESFGLSYIENFLGLGTLVVTPNVAANDVWSTNKLNLAGAYVPVDAAVGELFGMYSDESGLIGIKHVANDARAGIETYAKSGVVFFPEVLAGVFKGTVNPQ